MPAVALSRRSLQPDDVEPVVSALLSEYELLEYLLFAIGQQRELIEDSRSRWLPTSAAQVAETVDELRHLELLRAMAVSALELSDDPTLLEIAEQSAIVPAMTLRAHHESFVDIGRELLEAAAANLSLLERRHGDGYEVAVTALAQVVPRSLRDFLRASDGSDPFPSPDAPGGGPTS